MTTTTNNRLVFLGVVILAIIVGLLVYAFDKQKSIQLAPAATSSTPYYYTSSTEPTPSTTSTATTTPSTEDQIRVRADGLLAAFKNQNLTQIVSYIHPTKGVRFSMNTFVNVTTDKRLTRTQFQQYFNSNTKFTWGAGASGMPLVTTIKNYLAMHVYNEDYLTAPDIYYNDFVGQTSAVSNVKQIYPTAQIIEYHFPGFDDAYGGLDWQAVRFVFEQSNGQWYVVGIIHDYWSP